jgi:hypothetical protein
VWGHFEGADERSQITLLPSLEVKKGTQSGSQAAYASALSFGLPPGQLPFITDEGVSRSMRVGDAIEVCLTTTCASDIAPLASSFCYLSSVSGDFDGAAEWVQVFPNPASGTWRMDARAGGGSISARAECIEVNQTHTVVPPR